MKNTLSEKASLFLAIAVIIVAGASGYGIYSIKQLKGKLQTTTAALDSKITALDAVTAELKAKDAIIVDTLSAEQQKTVSIESAFGKVAGTVTNLAKLSNSDPELLKKYSKTYFLNEHYVPLSLIRLDANYSVDASKDLEIHSSVFPFLKKLLDDAAKTTALRVDSAYRSFGTQAQLKASYKFIYGAGTANQFSAEQGYSEHQLGTTVDFTTLPLNGSLSGFDTTAEYAWLQANAYKYGFVISYPKNNTYYEYEPWHWRFVGVILATKLHNDNIYFYDMDQRVIDTYLANMFD